MFDLNVAILGFVFPAADHLTILRNSCNNFRKASSGPQLNIQFVEAVDALLDGILFGVFSYHSAEPVLHEWAESYQTLDTLDLAGSRGKIVARLGDWNAHATPQPEFSIIPLSGAGGILGAVIAKGDLSPVQAGAVVHLAQLWGVARELHELEQNNQDLATELGRSLHNFSVVKGVVNAVSRAQDLKHLLSLILKVAINTVNGARGFIMLVNEKTGFLELKVVHGLPNADAEEKINSGLVQAARIPVGEGIQGRVMETREPVVLSGHLAAQDSLPGLGGMTDSVMCVPLVMNDAAFGVIYVTNKEDGEAFEKEDLDVLSILASHASAVIDQARLHGLASTDELTGLWSRRYYSQRVGDEMKRATRYRRTLSLLVIDIDHFKKVNDTYGHLAGDHILKGVAKILKNSVRTDLDTAVRFGGEEFVLLLPETQYVGALVVAERIRAAVEAEPMDFAGQTIRVTVSIGLSSFPESDSPVEELFDQADQAMYRSKENGRNRVTTFRGN